MGLDMTLCAKQHTYPACEEDVQKINKANALIGLDPLPVQPFPADRNHYVSEIVVTVMTWRKANAIHKWFVDNCTDDGEDNCHPIYITREELETLHGLCEAVIADNNLASEILPTKSGFFFGSTDYDEWYFGDIHATANGLKEILNNPIYQDCTFEYQASW